MVVAGREVVLAGRVVTLEGVTTVRVTVLDGWVVEEEAGVVVAAGRVIVVVVVAPAGRVLPVVAVASVRAEFTVEEFGLMSVVLLAGFTVVPVFTGFAWMSVGLDALLISVREPFTTLLLAIVEELLLLDPLLLNELPPPVVPAAIFS